MKSIWPTDLYLAQGISRGTIKLTEVNSTNRYLASLLEDDPALADFTTVVADHQFAGKGRFTRQWLDTPGDSVLMSVLVDCPTDLSQWVPLLAGISAVQALPGTGASLKWPNDIMVSGRKVAGILCELAAVAGDQARVIVGFGLNLSQVPAGAPQTAGSAVGQSSSQFLLEEKSALAVQIANTFIFELYSLLDTEDTAVWHQKFQAHLGGIGQKLTVTLSGGRQIQGINRGIDADGALLVEPDQESRVYLDPQAFHVAQPTQAAQAYQDSQIVADSLAAVNSPALQPSWDAQPSKQAPHLIRVTSGDVAMLEKKTEVAANDNH